MPSIIIVPPALERDASQRCKFVEMMHHPVQRSSTAIGWRHEGRKWSPPDGGNIGSMRWAKK